MGLAKFSRPAAFVWYYNSSLPNRHTTVELISQLDRTRLDHFKRLDCLVAPLRNHDNATTWWRTAAQNQFYDMNNLVINGILNN